MPKPSGSISLQLKRALLVLLLAGSAPVFGTGAEPTVRIVPPALTDPAITGGTGDHLVARADGYASGYLMLFFPGAAASPEQYTTLLRHAASRGHHVVGLAYRNELSVNFQLCLGQPQSGCHAEVRTEILTGENTSDLLDVDEPNSAFGRLRRLLVYLDTEYPDERWSGFLNDGEIAFERIIAVGHSQGGGHAAFTAKLHRVARSVLFSATEPAPWTEMTSATPEAAFFGVVHAGEQNATGMINSWSNLGLPGDLTDIDTVAPPYANSHRLKTERSDCGGDPESNGFTHNCTSADDWLPPPGPDGRPAFAGLWDYLLVLQPGGPDGAVFLAGPMGRPGFSYLDPETQAEESLLTFQDSAGDVFLADVDPLDGRFAVLGGRDRLLDTGAWPLAESFNGPEFGLDAEGWAVFYTKANEGVPALWRAQLNGDIVTAEPLTIGPRRQTVLASSDPQAQQTRLLFLRGTLFDGEVTWQDEDAPTSETPLGFNDLGVRWIDGTRRLVYIAADGPDAGEVVLVDTLTGSRRLLTSDGIPKSFAYGFHAPETDRLRVLALIDGATAIGVWEDPGEGGLFEPVATLTVPGPAGRTFGSPEPFIAAGRSWVSFIVRESAPGGPAEVWLARTDGSHSHRCDDGEVGLRRSDPETLVTRDGVIVYFNAIDPGGYRLYRCISRHPNLTDSLFSSSFEAAED